MGEPCVGRAPFHSSSHGAPYSTCGTVAQHTTQFHMAAIARSTCGTVAQHTTQFHMATCTVPYLVLCCHVVGSARHRLSQMSLWPSRLFVMTLAPTRGTFHPPSFSFVNPHCTTNYLTLGVSRASATGRLSTCCFQPLALALCLTDFSSFLLLIHSCHVCHPPPRHNLQARSRHNWHQGQHCLYLQLLQLLQHLR